MTIVEALSRLSEMPVASVLVAKPPLTANAGAMFVALTDDYRVPQTVTDSGYEYLLDREDILHLLNDLKKKEVSDRTIAEFVIHYAIHDCPPAWIDDIPDV